MKRVLIVDDKEENRYLLRLQMQAAGWKTEEAPHGAEALVKARVNPPTLIVSDLLMPVMDGYTLLRYWRADPVLQRIPFIVFTATYTQPQDERLALDLGADAFILKPAEPEKLLTRIDQVLKKGVLDRSPHSTPINDLQLLNREYSEVLVRKLEEKSLQLMEANHALAEREERLKLALTAARMGIWDWNMVTGDITWSQEHEALWGLQQESFQGTYAEFEAGVHRDDRERLNQTVQAALKQRTDYYCEYRVVWPDGSVHWIAGRGQAMYEKDKPVRMIGTVMDISDRHHAEELLQASESRVRAILDSMFAFVGLFTLDGRVIDLNHAAIVIGGIEKESVLNQFIWETPWIDHSPKVQEQITFAIANAARGEVVREDMDIRISDDSIITVDVVFSPIYDDTNKVVQVVASAVDITARKQAESMRHTLEEQLWQAQKMEALGTLAGGVAHDFNNILMVIGGNAELAQLEISKDHPANRYFSEIGKASGRAKELIEQILTFSRKQPMKQREIKLKSVIDECAAMLRNTFPKSITLHVTCHPDAPPVLADASQIYQVLLNLCTNAWHALQGEHGNIYNKLPRSKLTGY